MSNSRRFFDASIFVLNLNSLTKNIFHVCVFVSVTKSIPAKSARYIYLIQNRWCSEVFTYVYEYWIRDSGPKTKECAYIFSCRDGTKENLENTKKLLALWTFKTPAKSAKTHSKRPRKSQGKNKGNKNIKEKKDRVVSSQVWRDIHLGGSPELLRSQSVTPFCSLRGLHAVWISTVFKGDFFRETHLWEHFSLGAYAMTTKFLDNKICTFKILLSWRFPRQTAFWDDFPPPRPPPQKWKIYLCCRLTVSDSWSDKRNCSQNVSPKSKRINSEDGKG